MTARRCAALAALVLLAGCAGRGPVTAAPRAAAPPPVAGVALAPAPPPWSAADIAALHRGLAATLAASALPAAGIAIVDGAGRPLYLQHATQPYAPASNFKLLVGATALATLGSGYRFPTTLESAGDPVDGTVDGDVYLVGSGDPSLSSDDLRAGIGALAQRGIRSITGSVVADDTLFGGPEINPAWDRDDLDYDYAAPVGALSLDDGTVALEVDPTAVGAPARVVVTPASDAVAIRDDVRTGYGTALSIVREPGTNAFTLDGRVGARSDPTFVRPITGMAAYAASVASAMLRERGITVGGDAQVGAAPVAPEILWRHESAPLRDLLRTMFVESDNHYAEELLRTVGARRSGVGTVDSGAAVEREYLAAAGIPAPGLRIVDGSGLASSDRIAPITLAGILAHVGRTPAGGVYESALPLVGFEGTVRYRQLRDALGRVRAKSGHIEDVNSLSGYVQTRRHGRVIFSIVVNSRRADALAVDEGIDRTLDLLSRS